MSVGRDGPPRRHHRAMTGSQIAQPNDECAANGMIGAPLRWCTTSQAVCSSHATPVQV
jgi:hypothetical protein